MLTLLLAVLISVDVVTVPWTDSDDVAEPLFEAVSVRDDALSHLNAKDAARATDAVSKLGETRQQLFEDAMYVFEQLKSNAVPVLNDVLNQADYSNRIYINVIYAAGRLREHGKDVSDPLFEFLKHKDSSVRIATAQALGKIGNASRHSVVFLRPLLKDPDPEVRKATRTALQQIGTKSALRAVKQSQ